MTSQRILRAVLAITVALPLSVAVARAAFDDVEVSPRVRALGGTWAALTWDEYAPFHNPAVLAWAPASGAVSYVQPFGYDFSSQSVLAASMPLPHKLGSASLGIRRFGVDYQGENLTRETTWSVSHGFKLMEDAQSAVAFGWSLKAYVLSYGRSVAGVDPGQAATAGIDIGAVAVVRDRTRVGFYALNLNNPTIGMDHETLRRSVVVGVSYLPYPGVETVLDISNDLDHEVQYRGGAEFEIVPALLLRAGIQTQPNTFTAGIGFRHGSLRLDYGFSTGGGVLPESHQIGLGYVRPTK